MSKRIDFCCTHSAAISRVIAFDIEIAQSPLFVRQRHLQYRQYIIARERHQLEYGGAGYQRFIYLEKRVFGSGADKYDRTVLHVRQQRVLLRFIEAVYLVNEQHGAARRIHQQILRLRYDLFYFRDP